MAPSEPNQNPIQGEFFSADLPERFIRESVQNSLDARAGAEPVTVRFTISGTDGGVPGERAGPYLAGLQPHFEAVMGAPKYATVHEMESLSVVESEGWANWRTAVTPVWTNEVRPKMVHEDGSPGVYRRIFPQ